MLLIIAFPESSSMRRLVLGSLALLAFAGATQAQNFTTSPCNDHEGGSGWFSHDERACEIRKTVLPLNDGRVSVLGKNGNIEVIGEDRNDIALEARVTAQAPSRSEAEALLREIKVVTGSEIRADGPQVVGGVVVVGAEQAAVFGSGCVPLRDEVQVATRLRTISRVVDRHPQRR